MCDSRTQMDTLVCLGCNVLHHHGAANSRVGCATAVCSSGLWSLPLHVAYGWILPLSAERTIQQTSDAGQNESTLDAHGVCWGTSAGNLWRYLCRDGDRKTSGGAPLGGAVDRARACGVRGSAKRP